MKDNIKKITLFAVLTLVFLTVVLSVSACSGSSDGNEIIVVSEERFNSSVKPKDGEKLNFSPKKLRAYDEEKLIVGNRYYMLIHLEDKEFESGYIDVQGSVTKDEELLINSGSKNELTVEKGFLGFELANNDEKKGIKLYAALGFTADYEDVIDLSFDYFSNDDLKEIKANKAIVYPKQVTVSSSLKYLSEEDYYSGNDIDPKLTDSITAAVGEKVYAVIDYTLSGNSEIEDADTATLYISTSFDSDYISVVVEELPTADYKQNENGVTATFKIGRINEAERSFRFIVSFKAERAGTVGISASLSGEKISFLQNDSGSGYFADSVSVQFDVSQDVELESKLLFTLSEDQTYYILTGIGKETGDKITVPSSYNDLPVKEIAANVFSQSRYLKQITLSDGLEKIGVGAFSGCTGLKSIIIPKTVNSIGNNAFKDCNADIYCNIAEKPSGYADGWVADDAYVIYDFESCFEKDESGEYYIFSYERRIGSARVSVPAEYNYLPVKMIASEAFYGNTDLKSVKIPDSVTSIGSSAFYGCKGIDVYISDIAAWCGIDFENYSSNPLYYADNLYLNGKHITELVIPNSVTSIGDLAFYKCKGLTSITIGNGVTSIGSSAFSGCTGLKSVTIGNSVASIGNSAFDGCTGLTSITIPNSVTSIGDDAFV